MEAEIITIGTEILLGEIVDTNTRTLARRLRDIGIDIFLTSTVGDNAQRIADAVRASASRADIVITTGGLGPTIDDATREGIANGMEVELIFDDGLWQQIQDRFAQFGRTPSENNRRQAHIPAGALPIENPVGTAPSFILEADQTTVIALPGVPSEMLHLLENDVIPYLKQKIGSYEIIQTRLVRTAGIGESILDERISDLEQLSNPTVGLSAHPGRVDIRITAKAKTKVEADEKIWGIQATLEQRLRKDIYGFDDQTLEAVVIDLLRAQELTLATVEAGTEGMLAASIGELSDVLLASQCLTEGDLSEPVQSHLDKVMQSYDTGAGLGVRLAQDDEKGSSLEIVVSVQDQHTTIEEHYPAVFVNMQARAVSYALDRLRRTLLERTTT